MCCAAWLRARRVSIQPRVGWRAERQRPHTQPDRQTTDASLSLLSSSCLCFVFDVHVMSGALGETLCVGVGVALSLVPLSLL